MKRKNQGREWDKCLSDTKRGMEVRKEVENDFKKMTKDIEHKTVKGPRLSQKRKLERRGEGNERTKAVK